MKALLFNTQPPDCNANVSECQCIFLHLLFKKIKIRYYICDMGTEVFPHILIFLKFVVWAVIGISILTIVICSLEYRYAYFDNKEKQEEMKEHIVNSLITIVIVLIVYFLFAGIGPAFRYLFQ